MLQPAHGFVATEGACRASRCPSHVHARCTCVNANWPPGVIIAALTRLFAGSYLRYGKLIRVKRTTNNSRENVVQRSNELPVTNTVIMTYHNYHPGNNHASARGSIVRLGNSIAREEPANSVNDNRSKFCHLTDYQWLRSSIEDSSCFNRFAFIATHLARVHGTRV